MMWITNAILWLICASALEAARKYERHSAFHAQDWRLA
jgi:hypothetical protein